MKCCKNCDHWKPFKYMRATYGDCMKLVDNEIKPREVMTPKDFCCKDWDGSEGEPGDRE